VPRNDTIVNWYDLNANTEESNTELLWGFEELYFCAGFDSTFISLACIYLKNITGWLAGGDYCFVKWFCAAMYINYQEFAVNKNHIKGNEGVPHPEVSDLIPVKDKEHSHVIIHCFSKHEPPRLFCWGYCELNIKPA
jgi:hypothetical protein